MCKTSDILTEFGLAIRELRIDRQISQEALADICGLHRTYVSDIELGKRNISLENIGKIANALGVSIEFIFGKVKR